MIGWLSSLLLSLVVPAAAPPPPAAMPERRFVAWPHDGAAAPVAVAGLRLVNTSRACTAADGDVAVGSCWVAGVRIERAGAAPVELVGPPGMLARIGVGALTPGAPPAVILTTFTGGAHCCEQYEVAMPAPGGWRVTRVAWGPGGAGEQGGEGKPQTQFDGGLAGFPRDVDGDGVADFVLSDDRFDYAFGSYAGSAPPPIVLNYADGRWVDVSARRGFAPLFAADAAKRRGGCLDAKSFEHAGVCAGWAADAARLGRLTEVLPIAIAQGGHDQGTPGWDFHRCAGRFSLAACPAGPDAGYPTYAEALPAFLAAMGYGSGE